MANQAIHLRSLKSGKGFTLIELLVVISVIALLMSVLLPALGKARAHARRLKCTVNQKQVMVAGQLYFADNKGMFPKTSAPGWEYVSYAPPAGVEPGSRWFGFAGYITDYNVFFCPAVLKSNQVDYSLNSAETSWFYYKVDPAYEHLSHFWLYLCSWASPRTINSESYLRVLSNVVGSTCWPERYVFGLPGKKYFTEAPHGKRSLPMGFLDGHAESVPREQMIYDGNYTYGVVMLQAVRRPFVSQLEKLHPKSLPLSGRE